eukprot:5230960-Pleurochrysis_carterae.AAC.2
MRLADTDAFGRSSGARPGAEGGGVACWCDWHPMRAASERGRVASERASEMREAAGAAPGKVCDTVRERQHARCLPAASRIWRIRLMRGGVVSHSAHLRRRNA